MNKLRAMLVAVGVLVWVGQAQAGPGPDVCDPAVARDPQKMAEAGLKLYRAAQGIADPMVQAKEYEHALRCYRGAISTGQGSVAKIYHPLGLVYERLGRDVEAVEALQRFLREVPEDRRNVGVTKQINDKLAALKRRVGELEIDTVAGLEVRVDEAAVGRAPLGRLVVVAPGAHVVTVGDASAGTLGAEVQVAAGQLRRVDLTAWKPREQASQAQVAQSAQAGPPPGTLVVRSNRSGAAVQVDGAARGRTPLPELSLLPGPHALEARDGGQVLRRSLDVRAGQRLEVELRFPVKPWVWAVVGVAAAAVVGTAVGVGVYYGTGTRVPDGPLVSGWN